MKNELLARYEAAFGTPSLDLVLLPEYLLDDKLPLLMEQAIARKRVLTDRELVRLLGPHYPEGIR